MIGRIVEVADDRRHLFASRGFMVVQDTEDERKELGQVPLDDIAAVIANAHGSSYTNNLLVALAERGAPFVLCGTNHNTIGMLWPGTATINRPSASMRNSRQLAPLTNACGQRWCAINASNIGFEMAQFSVYMRFCTSQAQIDTYCKRVEKVLPEGGKIIPCLDYSIDSTPLHM